MNPIGDPGKGFADPIFDAQATFRALQDALARPGSIHSLSRRGIATQGGIPVSAIATLLTLADYSTPVWLKGGCNHPAAPWLAFHTGAGVIDVPSKAQFALIDGGETEPLLNGFAAGDDLYPDRSATVLVECRDFTSGPSVRLSGPGILDSAIIAPSGLRSGFWEEMHTNAAIFPRGVDVILVCGADIIGLPRTTRIEAGER